jgi:hypothetical protein
MNRSEPHAAHPDHARVEPEDVLRYVRRAGFGLLMASLVVNWASHRRDQWRGHIAEMRYRVLHDVSHPGAAIADLAIELLDATSPRRRRG